MMRGGDPVGLVGVAVFAVGAFAFLLLVLAARWRARGTRGGGSWQSVAGLVVQMLGFAAVVPGPVHVTLDPLSGRALAEALLIALLIGSAVALFAWSTRTLGREWSLVARTHADHRLVITGPYAWMRHPIYVAMAFALVALAVTLGHAGHLLWALPVFAFGTWLRVAAEERALRLRFGAAHDAYAGTVTRFIPGLF